MGWPLSELQAHQWLVAAVYRDRKLVVPHGDTVLQLGDRVLVVGEPRVIEAVAAFLRGARRSWASWW